ncbi:tripartite tricarboxylate transporter substrate binding protein [Comamonadaceae bacterium PP-2]
MRIPLKFDAARRHALSALACCAALATLPSAVQAQSAPAAAWPSRPLTLVVVFAPGGAADQVARIVAKGLGDRLGQTVVVDNRPGAGGTVGATFVARAPADGNTLLFVNSSHTASETLYPGHPYDLAKDFAPVSLVGTSPFWLLVNPKTHPSFNSVKDLVAAAKAKPGQLTFASGGSGGLTHMSGEELKSQAGIDMVHVPYKGNAPALTDVIAGRVDMIFDQQVSSEAFVKSGQLKPLAVTSSRRMPGAPQVPTLAESGFPQFDIVSWYGLALRTGTPQPIVDKLHAAIGEVLAEPDVRKKLQAAGVEPGATTPQAFGQLMHDDTARWGQVIRKAGITVQ